MRHQNTEKPGSHMGFPAFFVVMFIFAYI